MTTTSSSSNFNDIQPSPALPQPLFDNCAGGQFQDFQHWWQQQHGQSFDTSRHQGLLLQINSWDQCDFAEIVATPTGQLLLIDSTMQSDPALPPEFDYQHRIYPATPEAVKAVIERFVPNLDEQPQACYAVEGTANYPGFKTTIIEFASTEYDLETEADRTYPVTADTPNDLMLDISARMIQYQQHLQSQVQAQSQVGAQPQPTAHNQDAPTIQDAPTTPPPVDLDAERPGMLILPLEDPSLAQLEADGFDPLPTPQETALAYQSEADRMQPRLKALFNHLAPTAEAAPDQTFKLEGNQFDILVVTNLGGEGIGGLEIYAHGSDQPLVSYLPGRILDVEQASLIDLKAINERFDSIAQQFGAQQAKPDLKRDADGR